MTMVVDTRFTICGLNPNDVATFLVCLILSLPVTLKLSRHWRWVIFPAETLLVALLVGTGSRGGVLALICGLVWAAFLQRRNQHWSKECKPLVGICVVLVVGVIIGLAVFPKGFRVGTLNLSPEASAGRRLQVWSTVPTMLASAPGGWGIGQSAEAYEQWFEPVGETVALRHLLSSHLTCLVEWGWPYRWLYLFCWLAAIAILRPSRLFVFSVWGTAVWIGFFVALFYNAAGKWWNWPLPMIWLLTALFTRCQQRIFPSNYCWPLFLLVSGIVVGGPFLFSLLHPSVFKLRVRNHGNIVLIGEDKPRVAILDPSNDVLGNFYGQKIRKELSQQNPNPNSIVVVAKPETQDRSYLDNCDVYVISGADETKFSKWESIFKPKGKSELILINCRVSVDDWIKKFSLVVYCHGEFYGDPYYEVWKALSSKNSHILIREISGHAIYIDEWWPFLSAPPNR